MTRINFLLPVLCSFLLFTNCKDDDKTESVTPITPKTNTDTNANTNTPLINEIKDFIYEGLKQVYLYKDESPDLADNRFKNNTDKTNFINNGGSPEAFFDKLTISEDQFSFLIDDFEVLEGFFKGESLSNGLKFRRIRYAGDNVFIVITDVVKNSPAYNLGIKRGMIFSKINGAQMNIDNQAKLFTDNQFTLEEARIINNSIIPNNNTLSLTKINLNENPIAIAKVIEDGSNTIGYLQYNSFLTNYEEELNTEFANFKSQNLTDFVLDLRYNGGGALGTANILSGMLTGGFKGKILIKEQWNSQIQKELEEQNPERLIEVFKDTTIQGTKINSLGLSKLYIITSKQETASSSELVINSLKPYIDVVVIGDEKGTVGKSQGSITLYDSPDFSKDKRNTNHKYALQPLVVASVNSKGVGVPKDGIPPNIIATEDIENLGVLGNPNEPLLKKAIDDITGKNILSVKKINTSIGTDIGGSSENTPTYQRMYITR